MVSWFAARYAAICEAGVACSVSYAKRPENRTPDGTSWIEMVAVLTVHSLSEVQLQNLLAVVL